MRLQPLGGSGNDRGHATAPGPDGQAYITGSFEDRISIAEEDGESLSGRDIVVASVAPWSMPYLR
jgi:hypothetical protein